MGDWLYLIMLSILLSHRDWRDAGFSRALSHITPRPEGSDATTRFVPFLLFSEDIPVTFSRRGLGLGLQVAGRPNPAEHLLRDQTQV
jgi:hypothetical protein